jgi:hypothetical protein
LSSALKEAFSACSRAKVAFSDDMVLTESML